VLRSSLAGILNADWLLLPPEARAFLLAQQQDNAELRGQLASLATELAGLQERMGRRSLLHVNPRAY